MPITSRSWIWNWLKKNEKKKMGLPGQPEKFTLTYREGSFQFSGSRRETVKDVIFSDAVHPFPSGWHLARQKISAFSFSRSKWTNDLTGHVHDCDGVSSVANDNLVRILGHEVDTVDVNVSAGRRTSQRLKGVQTFRSFAIPDLDGAIWRATEKNWNTTKRFDQCKS